MIAAFLRRRLPFIPPAAVVLGSGLGELDLGAARREIPYRAIPGFPPAAVAGHPGRLTLTDRAIVLRGRVHLYEGRSLEEVVRPVRAMAELGVRVLLLTNAAGGVNPRYRPGDLMLISDHLNLMGANPLRGEPRFVDLSRAWDPELRRRARRKGLREGVYAAVPGPSYETPAEVRMLRRLGADAVGMSTVPEAIAAAAEGMRVLGISCITNRAAGAGRAPVSHEEVLRTMKGARRGVQAVLEKVLDGLQEEGLRDRPII